MPAPIPLHVLDEARALILAGATMSDTARQLKVDRASLHRRLGPLHEIRTAAAVAPELSEAPGPRAPDRVLPRGLRNLEIDDQPARRRSRRPPPVVAAPATPAAPAQPPRPDRPRQQRPPAAPTPPEADEPAAPGGPRRGPPGRLVPMPPIPPGDLPPGLERSQLERMMEAVYEAGTSFTLAAIGAGQNPSRLARWLQSARTSWQKGEEGGAECRVALALYGALAAYDERIGSATTRLAELGEVRALGVAHERAKAATPSFEADEVADGSAEILGFAEQVRRYAMQQSQEAPEALGVRATRGGR